VLIYFVCLILGFLLFPKKTLFYRYSLGVLFAVDCLANVALLLGDYRETISSRVGKAYLRGVKWILPVMWVIDLFFLVFAWEKHHCVKNIQDNVGSKSILRWK